MQNEELHRNNIFIPLLFMGEKIYNQKILQNQTAFELICSFPEILAKRSLIYLNFREVNNLCYINDKSRIFCVNS